jgi:hypothetical protein
MSSGVAIGALRRDSWRPVRAFRQESLNVPWGFLALGAHCRRPASRMARDLASIHGGSGRNFDAVSSQPCRKVGRHRVRRVKVRILDPPKRICVQPRPVRRLCPRKSCCRYRIHFSPQLVVSVPPQQSRCEGRGCRCSAVGQVHLNPLNLAGSGLRTRVITSNLELRLTVTFSAVV